MLANRRFSDISSDHDQVASDRHLIDAVHELADDKQSQRQRDQLDSVRELRQPERKTLGAGLEVLANCGKQQSQSRQDDPTMAALVPEAFTCARLRDYRPFFQGLQKLAPD